VSATLKEQLKALEQLQAVDLQIGGLKTQRQSLPGALKTLDDALNRVKANHTIKKNTVEELNKVFRQTKAALELNQDRLTRSMTRLEGIQNSQEFSAVNKEIDQLRKLAHTLEEQQKKANDEIAVGTKGLEDLEAQMVTLQAERDEKASAVTGQDNELNSQISKLQDDRKKYTTIVEARILTNYDRVRGARAGIGISSANGGRCKICNMMVPPQLYNEIQKGLQVHSCPSCHRILYIPTEGSAGVASSTKSEASI
jgi:predicted  nucleic acid-binding Zn-ribbon protein